MFQQQLVAPNDRAMPLKRKLLDRNGQTEEIVGLFMCPNQGFDFMTQVRIPHADAIQIGCALRLICQR